MAPPRKPPAKRQRRNQPRKLAIVPTMPPGVPAIELQWLPATREGWIGYWQSALSEYLTPTDLPAVRRLFGMRDERERLHAAVIGGLKARDKNGEETTVSGHLVPGSTGQMVLNPLLKRVSDLDAEIRQLEDRFGLNLKGRFAFGVQVGQAQKTLEELNALADRNEDEAADDPRAAILQSAPNQRRANASEPRG